MKISLSLCFCLFLFLSISLLAIRSNPVPSRLSRGTGRVFSKDHGIVPTLSICLFKRPRVHRSPVLYTKTLLIASHVLPPLGCVHLLVSFHVRVYQHPRLLADPSCVLHRLDLPHVKTTDQAHDQT